MIEPTIIAHDDEASPADGASAEALEHQESALVEEELLVEDVSIDGLCGVY
jgi:mycofactocin precursor